MKFVRGHDLYILNVLCKLLFVQLLSQHHPHSLDQHASDCLRNLIGEGRHIAVPQRKRDIRILIMQDSIEIRWAVWTHDLRKQL